MKNKDVHPRGRVVNDAFAIFDIDGCIVDAEGNPIPMGVQVLKDTIARGDFVIFATQRPFTTADATSKYIQDQFDLLPFHDFTILMRRENDERPVPELKREFAHFCGELAQKDGLEVTAVYDSDKEVVKVYQQMGFAAKVLNARTGTEEALQDLIEEDPLPPPPIITAANAQVLAALFPDGVVLKTAEDHTKYQMFGIMLASTARFAYSGFADKMALREMAEMVKFMNR